MGAWRKGKWDEGGEEHSGDEDSRRQSDGRAAVRGMKKAKAPNPLSVLSKKTKLVANGSNRQAGGTESLVPKSRRKRKHGSKNTPQNGEEVIDVH